MMVRRRSVAFFIAWVCGIWAAGCTASKGDACLQDSDCPAGMWCHSSEGICVEVTCDPTTEKCQSSTDLEPDVQEDSSVEDTGTEDLIPEDSQMSSDVVYGDCAVGTGITWNVTSFLISENASAGHGLDVDEDPETCAPADDCDDGVDNAFGTLSSLVNQFMVKGIADGDIQIAVHQPDPPCSGLVLLKRSDDTSVSVESYSDGEPVSLIPALSSEAGALSAGPGGTFRMPLAVLGVILEVELQNVSLIGETDGDALHLIVGAALPYEELESAIFSIPEENLPSSVSSHQGIMDIIEPALQTDIDLDADGTNESISMALQIDGTLSDLVFPN